MPARGSRSPGRALLKMNRSDRGFDCPGCAWPDDLDGLRMYFCENGVKHVAWELTGKRVGREFFERHTVAELSEWNDHDLEALGRLTEPLAYDAASDRYVPISWKDASARPCAGSRARTRPPSTRRGGWGTTRRSYTSSRVRAFGANNLPDCSNMSHYEELDQLAAAKPFAKAAYRISRVEDIGLGVARAFRTAVSGRPVTWSCSLALG